MCRIAKDANTSKSKSLLLLPALPALLAALSGLGLVVPSSGVFVEVRRQLIIKCKEEQTSCASTKWLTKTWQTLACQSSAIVYLDIYIYSHITERALNGFLDIFTECTH